MWSKQARIQHEPRKDRYPSDMTDAEWALIAPTIPPPRRGGRPRETDMREVMNAVRYVLRQDANGGNYRRIFRLTPRFTTISGNGAATVFSIGSIMRC